MAAAAVLALLPALGQWDLSRAAGWAQVVWLLALLQLAYAAYLALAPDWSTAWVAMIAAAMVATLYAAGMAMTLTTKPNTSSVLDLSEVVRAGGRWAVWWCGLVMAANTAIAYACGAASSRWRRAVGGAAGKQR